jgi:hypothetical protein
MNLIEINDKIAGFEGVIEATDAGMYGLTFRLVPNHKLISKFQETHLVKWA